MKLLAAFLISGAVLLEGQSFTAKVVSGSSQTPLGSLYAFDSTPAGSVSSIVIRIANASNKTVTVFAVAASPSIDGSVLSSDFNVTGYSVNKNLVPGNAASFEEVSVSFAPQTEGLKNANLLVSYAIQDNACSVALGECVTGVALIAGLQGVATPAALVVSAQGNVLQSSGGVVEFGNVSLSSSTQITFTIANQGSSSLSTPSVRIDTPAYDATAFRLDLSGLPAALAPADSKSFTVTFAPGQAIRNTTTLHVGPWSYTIAGTGIVVAGVDGLNISYVDGTGVRMLPQAATPISFGSGSQPVNLTFTLANPSTSLSAISVPSVLVSGNGFSTSGAPPGSFSISPGQSVSFIVRFTPGNPGTYSGVLSIGSRQFTVTATASQPAVDASIRVDIEPLVSATQAHVSIQAATAPTADVIGQLTMAFTPSASGASDDPAITFVATGGRQIQVTFAAGSQVAAYNGTSSLTFQTGTTAGTITFTLTLPNQTPVIKSYAITPAQIQITSSSAVRQSPNLVVTFAAFDNTYTAGNLSFVFFDTAGKQINATPIAVDASTKFHEFFTTISKAGGSFSVQASFPVTGDVNQIGSVRIGVSNSSGTSTVTQTFQ